MSEVINPPKKDKYQVLHERLSIEMEAEAEIDPYSEEATAELRSLGSILAPVSPEQREQLDSIAALRPTIKKLSRRKKKAERKKSL